MFFSPEFLLINKVLDMPVGDRGYDKGYVRCSDCHNLKTYESKRGMSFCKCALQPGKKVLVNSWRRCTLFRPRTIIEGIVYAHVQKSRDRSQKPKIPKITKETARKMATI